MAFKKATKTSSKLRAALFGPAGAGKTWTALSVGSGMGGKIALIDSERGSASKYADRFDFDTQILEKKTVDEYISCINEAAAAGYDVLIIDSMTHAWETLCEEVQKIADARYKGNYWAAWSEGTPMQRKFIETLISYPGHIIATMRSKTEWQTDSGGGKSKPVRVGLSPEQGKGIEYEFDILFEITPEHLATIIKDRTGKFQDKIIEKPGKAFGEELVAWLNEGAPPPPTPPKQGDLYQQCVEGMKELKNIMLSTADDKSRLFSDEEYNHVKETLNGLVELTLEKRLAEINDLLDAFKSILSERYDDWYKHNHIGQENVPAKQETTPTATQPEKPSAPASSQPSKLAPKNDKQSLSNELREMMRKKHEEQQQAMASPVATDEQRAQIAASIAKDLGLKPASAVTQKTTSAVPADGFVDDIPGQEEPYYDPSEEEMAGVETSDGLDIF